MSETQNDYVRDQREAEEAEWFEALDGWFEEASREGDR